MNAPRSMLVGLLCGAAWSAAARAQEPAPAPEAPPAPPAPAPEAPPAPPAPAPEAPPAPSPAPVTRVFGGPGPARPLAEAPVEAEGRLAEVRIEGLKRVEEAAILAAVGLRAGEDLAGWKVTRDIEAVWATGFVDDVRVELDATPKGPVLRFVVDEKPAIREIKFAGNKKLDEEALKEAVDLVPFSVLNEADLKANVARMRDKYLEKGFYLVEIEPEIREVADELVELTFRITENRKVLVQRVDIVGNTSVPDRKIRRYMQTKPAGILPFLTSSGAFNEQALSDDTQTVRSVFLEEGYVDAQVDEPQVFLSPDKRFIYVTFQVTEGPRYKIGKVKVQGDFIADEGLTEDAVREVLRGRTAATVSERWQRALAKAKASGGDAARPAPGWEKGGRSVLRFDPSNPPLENGDWFKLSTMQQALAEVSDLYGDQGYAFANVVPLTDTDASAEVVDITLDIQRGDKMTIRRIDISGNDPTFDKVIRREIPLNEGEIYSGSKIKDGRQRLERLGYFEEVRISTPRAPEPQQLDMKVEVVEQPTGSFSVGAGFSNIENFMLTMNVSKNNFVGLGYVMSAAANISSFRQQGNLQLYDPYFLDSRWTLRLDAYSNSQQFILDQYQNGASFSVGRYVDKRDDMRVTFDYSFEDVGLNNVGSYEQRLFGGELFRSGTTSTGGLSFIVDKRNNRIQATRGVFATASAGLSGGFRRGDSEEVVSVFGGKFNFVEAKLNLRAYQPVVPKGEWLIFKFNSSLGRIWSTDGTIVPWVQRYRAGGIQSVRGYNWFSLGPSVRGLGFQNSGGNQTTFFGSEDPSAPDDRLITGGTETFVNNFELESPIVKQAGISTVLFFDAGNTFGDIYGDGHISIQDLRFSYGFGVRWFSPMGPLRFEWGFPVNPLPDERRAVFDFSIGSLF